VAKQILCGFGVDIDAVAGWLGSYGGKDSPSDIQRGMFAGEVGVPRLLKLFDKFKLKASWFALVHGQSERRSLLHVECHMILAYAGGAPKKMP